MTKQNYKAVHYLNQFFSQIGSEEEASITPLIKEGVIGPEGTVSPSNTDAAVSQEQGQGQHPVDHVVSVPDHHGGFVQIPTRVHFPVVPDKAVEHGHVVGDREHRREEQRVAGGGEVIADPGRRRVPFVLIHGGRLVDGAPVGHPYPFPYKEGEGAVTGPDIPGEPAQDAQGRGKRRARATDHDLAPESGFGLGHGEIGFVPLELHAALGDNLTASSTVAGVAEDEPGDQGGDFILHLDGLAFGHRLPFQPMAVKWTTSPPSRTTGTPSRRFTETPIPTASHDIKATNRNAIPMMPTQKAVASA